MVATPVLFAVAVQESLGVAWAELTTPGEVWIKACLRQVLSRHTNLCLYAVCGTKCFS